MNEARVTITGPVDTRTVMTKQNLPKPIYSQKATLETEAMRIQIDVEVDGPEKGYPVGAVKLWDLVADVVPGRYGPELARRMTLVDPQPAKRAA